MPLPQLPTLHSALLKILDKYAQPKTLILEDYLVRVVGREVGGTTLREHGVEGGVKRLSKLEQDNPDVVIMILRPTTKNMITLIKFLKAHLEQKLEPSQNRKQFNLYCVPRRSLIAERMLEESGIYGDIFVDEFPIDFISLENDLLSMEIPDSFSSLFADGDTTHLFYAARSITRLEAYVGRIPTIKARGKFSKNFSNISLTIAISNDMITPLCTQLTYEGLIDEKLGINSTLVDLPLTNPPSKTSLHNGMPLYAALRDLPFHQVGPFLHHTATRLNAQYEEGSKKTEVGELKEFVGKLGGIRDDAGGLRIHTHITEQLVQYTNESDFTRSLEVQQNFLAGIETGLGQEYIEELMYRGVNPDKVLRLLCLWSTTGSGLKPKIYEFFVKELVQSYGIEVLVTLHRLGEAGLFTSNSQASTPSFSSQRKQYQLTADRDDMSYTYAGYAPLSIRLIEEMLDDSSGRWEDTKDKDVKKGPIKESRKRNGMTMIMFIGGITFAEISALRYMYHRRKNGGELLIATTGIINSQSILKELIYV